MRQKGISRQNRSLRAASAFAIALTLALLAPTLAQAAPARTADPLYVSLDASPLYVRAGFDAGTIATIPAAGAAGWKTLPPAGPAGRNMRIGALDLEGSPKRPHFSLKTYPTMEFTYLMPFELSVEAARLMGAADAKGATPSPREGAARSSLIPGIYLAGLGDNWEIYLNGSLVQSEMHPLKAGRIGAHRSYRYVRFPVDGRIFREGANVLAIKALADPTFPPAGLNQAKPFYVGEYRAIERDQSETGAMILIGLYIFIGLYHLFMFLVRTQDRHNLFYGLFSVDLGLYLLMRTYSISLVLKDSDAIFRIELFTLALILPLVGAFLETLNDDRIRKVTYWYGGFCALVGLGELIMPTPFTHDLLRVWQVSGLVMAFYYFGIDIIGRFIADGRRRWKRERGNEDGRPLLRIYGKALLRTPVGNLVIGGSILFATAVFDIVDAVALQWDLVLTKYGFFLFTMGTAFILANRLGFLHDRLSGLNHTLEERIRVLTETGARLEASERRYRSLFEGSSDPVALLTENLAFIEGNRAAAELFGLDREDSAGLRLYDALYADKREGSLPAEFLRAAARALADKVGPGEISLRIKGPLAEPKPCTLRLERIDALERKEILLRVVPEERDPLTDCFVEGRERFDIESSLAAADRACRRAAAHLSRYADADEARFLASCLREVVVNAVEHGNLELSFDEKSRSMGEGRYFELLAARRLDPRFRSRKVVVEYSISASRATFRVSDEGPGFDHRRFVGEPGSAAPEPSEELLEHGRGLFITMSAFDKVLFNERGNQVTLVRAFRKDPA
jgi:PAS domain-containing protein